MNRHDRRRYAAISKNGAKLSPAEQFAAALPFGRILAELGVVPGLTAEQFDQFSAGITNSELMRNRAPEDQK